MNLHKRLRGRNKKKSHEQGLGGFQVGDTVFVKKDYRNKKICKIGKIVDMPYSFCYKVKIGWFKWVYVEFFDLQWSNEIQ